MILDGLPLEEPGFAARYRGGGARRLRTSMRTMMAPMNANLNSVRALMERIHVPYIQQDEKASLKPLMTEG